MRRLSTPTPSVSGPAVAGIDIRLGRGKRALRAVKEPDDIVVQRALVALQRQGVVAALPDDLAPIRFS